MVLDRFLGDIAPRTISLALVDRHRAIFERRQILVDLLDLILDFAGVGFFAHPIRLARHGTNFRGRTYPWLVPLGQRLDHAHHGHAHSD